MLTKMNHIKRIMCYGFLGVVFQAQAEVLVILPDSGPMARAGESIKLGIEAAHAASRTDIPLKFVNTDQYDISTVLNTNVNASTKMVIGPLSRADVESLIASNPSIPALALNEIATKHPNVWQFSLSKDQDASALMYILQKDQIERMYVIREKGTEAESLTFINALFKQFPDEVTLVDDIPKMNPKDGLLLLGANAWIQSFKKLPEKKVYVQAISIEQNKRLPKGIRFCDVNALYQSNWQDVEHLLKSHPTTPAFQRLYAFGADAWQIAEQFVMRPEVRNLKFSGRTGHLVISENEITRTPQCYEQKRRKVEAIK